KANTCSTLNELKIKAAKHLNKAYKYSDRKSQMYHFSKRKADINTHGLHLQPRKCINRNYKLE
ncbi:hypothetical protein NDU88_003982, partial [Pleurodeles waltl]